MRLLTNSRVRYLFFVPFFLIFAPTYGQQVKVKCFGINQTIPVFKADANFSVAMDDQNSLIKKGILKPIKQSDAIVEIRYLNFPAALSEDYINILKFYKDSVRIYRYVTAVSMIGSPMSDEYKLFKDIGPNNSEAKLTNLFKVTDMTAYYNKYDWNAFFKILIDNHLFDIISGKELIDSIRTVTDEYNYPQGEVTSIIQLKIGKQYRNLNVSGSYSNPKYKDIDLIKFETNFKRLLNSFFGKTRIN